MLYMAVKPESCIKGRTRTEVTRRRRELRDVQRHYSGDQVKGYEMGGHVARMAENRNAKRVLVGNVKETDHLADKGVDDWIILK